MTHPGMTPARFQVVRAHFEAALDTSPEDLEAWLAARIPDDPALRHDVRTLVRAHLEDSLTLVSPFSPAGWFDSGMTDRTGERVGAWTVVRQIGAGGMGTVYEAHRAEGEFDQRAAIKFLRRDYAADATWSALEPALPRRRPVPPGARPNKRGIVD